MKTKIRTLLTICAFAFIGLININATSDNKKTVSTEVASENTEMFTNESWMSENYLIYSADTFTSLDLKREIDQFESKQDAAESNVFNTDAFKYSAFENTANGTVNKTENQAGEQAVNESNENDLRSAESFTASGADQEIEKYAEKQVAMQQNRTGK